MPAYWMARAKIIDPVAYGRYREATKEASIKFPRKVLAQGGRYQILEGQTHFERFVILEYPSFESALDYFHSPGYQAAAELRRHGGGENEVVILDGIKEG